MPQGVCRSSAFCLHVRPYRESSAILQLFTRDFGRIAVVQRGARSTGQRRRAPSSSVQPFAPLYAEWYGVRELKTLARVEGDSSPLLLSGESLLAGLYLNELLSLTLPEQQEHLVVYDAYQHTLQQLVDAVSLEIPLRHFERCLLEELGYGIPFHAVDREGHHRDDLRSDIRYTYVPENGFIACESDHNEAAFPGEYLLKVAAGELDSPEVLRVAKHLMRRALLMLLDGKPLNSRRLFF